MKIDKEEVGVDEDVEDRISNLPDDVICEKILSLLPTKDSVRTSALSTRWKHLYAFVPVFDSKGIWVSRVISEVLNSITINLPRISKFRIYQMYCANSDYVYWIDSATSLSVQTLDIDSFCAGHGCTPCSLFTCETLVSLRLNLDIALSVPDVVHMPNLKELSLVKIQLQDDESVRRLFSSCPVLESLVVFPESMPNVGVFNVSIPSLKVLTLYLYQLKAELIINCPNLERLECREFYGRRYSRDVLKSLKKCDIHIDIRIGTSAEQLQEGKLIKLVRQVCKVQQLSLAADSMEALLYPTGSLPTFENLTRLELSSNASDGWRMLASILDSSPLLETLVFRKGFLDKSYTCGNPFPPPENVPVCLSSHPQVIRIHRFLGEEDEYKWVEYILTNALVLEKMEIHPRLCKCKEEEYSSSFEVKCENEDVRDGISNLLRNFKISTRLSTFRPLSEGCQIVIVSLNDQEGAVAVEG